MRNSVPKEFTVGESLEWKKSFFDYPASEWTLTYYFRGAGPGFNAVATADGDGFFITVAKTVTASCSAGIYYFQAFVEKGSEKFLIDEGEVKVIASLVAVATTTTLDNRSQIKITLDNIDAMIAGKATLDQQEYTIGDRQLKRYPIPDLLEMRKEYARLYEQEKRTEAKKKGGGVFKNYKVKFRNPR
jgi:hypothetical protein